VYIQVHLLLMPPDRDMLEVLENPQLLAVAVVLPVLALMRVDQTLEMVVLELHIVLLVSQHTMLVVAVVVIVLVAVVKVDQV
tara:strand:+ start:1497 stop:1742 length:246 start_codon:yes stop_codon:yes gene_type:complete